MLTTLRERPLRLWRFVRDEIWNVELDSLSKKSRFGIRFVRVAQLVIKGFREDACPLHASALTFSTLMAIVPFLAVVLMVLRGFGAGELAEDKILGSVSAMPAEFQTFVRDMLASVESVNYTALSGIGLFVLLWMVVQVLGRVEWSFNRVWGIASSRPLLRKFSDYISILMIVPALMLAATAINTTLSSEAFTALMQRRLGPAAFMYKRFMLMMPWLVTWVAFAFVFKFVPNTRVHLWPAMVSGFIGGSLWIGWQLVYIRLQFRVARYNAIYGTFASVPIFLAWLYVSWEIVLLGAEVAFAVQNSGTFALERRSQNATARSRLLLAVSVLARAADAMLGRAANLDISSFSKEKVVPVRLLHDVVGKLGAAGLLAEVGAEGETYILARAPETIRLKDAWNVIAAGEVGQPFKTDRMDPRALEALEKLDAGLEASFGETTVRDLVEKSADG